MITSNKDSMQYPKRACVLGLGGRDHKGRDGVACASRKRQSARLIRGEAGGGVVFVGDEASPPLP